MGIVVLRLSLVLVALAFTSAAFAAKKKPLSSVADLRYGVALFHYYQDDYTAALTELLVAEKRGGIKGHGDNPELMEGAFSLGYGMERHATEIFERLLEQNRPQKVRDAAWFYLSKLRYLREDWAGAEDAVERISQKPAKSIRDELLAHRVNLAIKQNKLEQAARLLDLQKDKKGWLPYLNFNLGSAYARNRDFANAIQYFSELQYKERLRPEHKALYDNAMTAAGYANIFLEDYEQAIFFFSKVRLTSALSNRALLGYGWAAAAQQKYEEALKPWLYLSDNTLLDENGLEALVAVPHAYEQLDLKNKALERYLIAEEKYEAEIIKLGDVIELMDGDTLLQVLEIEGSSGLDWLKYAKENQLEPKLSYLADLFAKEAFQGFVQELRDLIALRAEFADWQNKLGFYGDSLDQRIAYRQSQRDALEQGGQQTVLTQQKLKLKRMQAELDRINREQDYFALAEGDEVDLVERVSRLEKNIELLRATDPFIDENEEMARWYYGMVLWQTSEMFVDRAWKIEKGLAQLKRSIDENEKTTATVKGILQSSNDLQPKVAEVANAKANVESMLADLDRVIENAKLRLSTNIVDVLSEQKHRVTGYLGQSRLSIARLYDQANPEVWDPTFEDLEDELPAAEDVQREAPSADADESPENPGGQR